MPKSKSLPGVTSLAQELKDSEKRIAGLNGVLRAYLSEKSNPQIAEKDIAFHREQIEIHENYIKVLNDRQNGNGHHIDEMKEKIRLAKRTWARLKHARQIEKLLKLQKEIKEGFTDDDSDEG